LIGQLRQRCELVQDDGHAAAGVPVVEFKRSRAETVEEAFGDN